jgi:hypothetical protein
MVKEVSLVDRPAILREFLVIKRQEENMGAFEKDREDGGSSEEINKALPADLATAIKDCVAWLGQQKGDGVPMDSIARVVSFLGKVAGGSYPYPSPESKATPDKKAPGSAGACKEDATTKAAADNKGETKAAPELCPKCKGAMKDGVCEKCGYEAKSIPAKKNLVEIDEDGRVTINADVAKGGKQFTSERTASLADTARKMLELLAGVDSEAAKGVMEALVGKELPGSIKWTSATTATPAKSVSKSEIEEAVKAATSPLQSKLEETEKRLATIENTRPAPKGEGDGTDKGIVTKSDNIWKGLI